MRPVNRWSVLIVVGIILIQAAAFAQFSGSRGGVQDGRDQNVRDQNRFPELRPTVAGRYITIEGQAELRLAPTEIRIVLAVTAEKPTPVECRTQVKETIDELRAAWQEAGIAPDNIVEDFIAILPRYEFEVKQLSGRQVAVEKKAGLILQSNVHLSVRDDAQAMQALDVAFEHGVSDIIAFDYWSRDLDEIKVKARAAAVKAARDKAGVLLGALFAEVPPAINVQEQTRVVYPRSLYESFTNSNDEEYQTSYHQRDMPLIRTYRPKNTYYRGLYLDGDVQAKELPMRSEISVVSTVRLYYQSPAAKTPRHDDD